MAARQPGAVGVARRWLPGELFSTLQNERCLGIRRREEQCEVPDMCKSLKILRRKQREADVSSAQHKVRTNGWALEGLYTPALRTRDCLL